MIKIIMLNGKIRKVEECDATGKEIYRELQPLVDYFIVNEEKTKRM